MAFAGRGGFSPRGSRGGSGSGGSKGNKGGFGRGGFGDFEESGERMRGYYGFGGRVHYYIPLDNTYFQIQMALTFLILIIGVITYVVTYKSSIIDPIASIKRTYLNSYMITIAIILVVTFVLHRIFEDEDDLIPMLAIVLIGSLVVMAFFFNYKLNMDKTYTNAEFQKIYSQQYSGDGKTLVTIGLSGAALKTQKEIYVGECNALYRNFTIKVYTVLVLHALLNILLIYQISRVIKRDSKRDRLEKDDIVVYDPEQNIKM